MQPTLKMVYDTVKNGASRDPLMAINCILQSVTIGFGALMAAIQTGWSYGMANTSNRLPSLDSSQQRTAKTFVVLGTHLSALTEAVIRALLSVPRVPVQANDDPRSSRVLAFIIILLLSLSPLPRFQYDIL